MNRPLSSSQYQPRWSSPLTLPPLQESGAAIREHGHDPKVTAAEFRRSLDKPPQGPTLARSSVYSRGRHHPRSSPIPTAPIYPAATTKPPRPIRLDLAAREYELPRPVPSPSRSSQSRRPSFSVRSFGPTEYQASLPGSSHALKDSMNAVEFGPAMAKPPGLESYTLNFPMPDRPSIPIKSLPDPLDSPRVEGQTEHAMSRNPMAAIGPAIPPRAHVRIFAVPPRPKSEFRTKDEESRDLLTRMANHTRNLSGEQRHQLVVPRISAPREIGHRPDSATIRAEGRRSLILPSITAANPPPPPAPAQAIVRRQDPMLKARKEVWDMHPPDDEPNVLRKPRPTTTCPSRSWNPFSLIKACFGRQEDTDDDANVEVKGVIKPPPVTNSMHIITLDPHPSRSADGNKVRWSQANLGLDITPVRSCREADSQTIAGSMSPMSKCRRLRLGKRDESRSLIFDAPLTTIRP